MKAIILSAGKSTRTVPLTLTRPKPLLYAGNTTIIEHLLMTIHTFVDEILIVIGYKGDMIQKHLGASFRGVPLHYIHQKEQEGTAHALARCDDQRGKFLVINGDDLLEKKDIERLSSVSTGILVKESKHPERFGQVIVTEGIVQKIIEKPPTIQSKLVSCGAYMFNDSIFPILKTLGKSSRGEYEIPEAFNQLCKKETVNAIEATHWHPISYPWDLLTANEHILGSLKKDIKGTVEKNVTIHGEVVVGEGTTIRSGSYIIGPVIIGKNCIIGPNAFIRGATSIGDNCRVGPAEIKNSIFFPGAHSDHVSYVGDSVFGSRAHLGAHTVIANLRHDGANMKSMVNEKLVDTGRRKLGVILGDNTDTGINTTFYPGRKMWPNTSTVPGEIVKRDVVN